MTLGKELGESLGEENTEYSYYRQSKAQYGEASSSYMWYHQHVHLSISRSLPLISNEFKSSLLDKFSLGRWESIRRSKWASMDLKWRIRVKVHLASWFDSSLQQENLLREPAGSSAPLFPLFTLGNSTLNQVNTSKVWGTELLHVSSITKCNITLPNAKGLPKTFLFVNKVLSFLSSKRHRLLSVPPPRGKHGLDFRHKYYHECPWYLFAFQREN